MAGPDAAGARARVQLVREGLVVELPPIDEALPCDLALVDGLLRFELAARRLGWRVRLRDVAGDLRELLELAGQAGRLGG